MAGLAGCLEGVQEHFDFQGVVPIEVVNEGRSSYNLRLEARETDTGRQTYDESFSITPDERAMPHHLERVDQRFRIVKYEGQEQVEVREVSITPETEHLNVYVRDDDLIVDVRRGDGADGNESVEAISADGNVTDGRDDEFDGDGESSPESNDSADSSGGD
ncbi:hypothetical protein C446_17991 [Halobiforma nitratireducens JCM 10879]|uniref:Uncharacterized protein n=1 Tax=Halobiforma nitratireducens JCM 10879 TaxID=1227454 RepID=M0L5Q6_9EURY|nr:hypothetical protein C446_17991 [Halobiforma nitratireducens JCM 10879]